MKALLALIIPILFLFSCNSDIDSGEIYALEVLQSNTLEQFAYGEERIYEMKEFSEDKSNGEALIRAKKYYRFMLEVDSVSGNCISLIEKMKREMFTNFNEELSIKKEVSIIHYDYAKEKNSRPATYTLSNVKYSGGSDILNSENRIVLIKSIRNLRRELCEIVERSWISNTDFGFFFKDPLINNFKNKKDFDRQFDEKIKQSKIALDDLEMIRKTYFLLSKTDKQWESILTEKDSWVDVMNVLLSLENEILQARGMALTQLLYGRMGCMGSYSFTKILPLVNGPNAAVAGDTVQLEILMAAYDEYKTPIITVSGGRVEKIREGKGYISVVVPNSKELEVKGTITIMNKSGIPKTNGWSHKINVIK